MKTCKYCGSKNKNSAEKCTSCCGSEFKYICENCRMEFDTGTYCPVCGVKAGRAARTCPECGEVYFTRACPECGYTSAHSSSWRGVDPNKHYQPKRVKTGVGTGTVLLWIFFFPIMATIAIWKSGWGKKLKIGITALLWVFCLIAGLGGGESAPEELPEASPEPAVIRGSAVIESGQTLDTLSGEDEDGPEATAEPTPEPAPEPTPEPTPDSIQAVAGYVDADELNLRAEPSQDADILERYEYGQSLEILGEDGGWYMVSVGGVTGYMAKEYVGNGDAPARQEREGREEQEAAPGIAAPEVQATEQPRVIPYEHNYHGKVYTGGEYSEKYHYEGDCAGNKSHEITWEEVERRGLGPCATCVLQ